MRSYECDDGAGLVRADGKLVVRSSQADDADPNRKAVATEWTRWVGEIEKRKA